jgi:hypothetical protein
MSQITYQSLVLYVFINITLIFSLALPAAGMVNHLLPSGAPTIGRGLLLWLLFSILTFLLTLIALPIIRNRLQKRTGSGEQNLDL